MNYTKMMGAALPERQWVPSPTYILRRAAILDWLRREPPGRVIEFGCGPGALLHDLSKRGFHGLGVEQSPKSLALSREFLADSNNIKVADSPDGFSPGSADYLLSFEVLEHIEYDDLALREWLTFLKPGGTILLSVPAHSQRWNITDINAGHFRRYDRTDVIRLLESAGLKIERIGTYGWPVSRLIETLRERVTRSSLQARGESAAEIQKGDANRTMESGSDRSIETRLFRYYGNVLGQFGFLVAAQTQRLFYNTDLGISFIVRARKAGA